MSDTATEKATRPSSIVVSLKAGGVFFAIANVLCCAMIVWAYMTLKMEPKTLNITGSARKVFTSDLITWSAGIAAKDPSLPAAYAKLKADADKVRDFLVARGIKNEEIVFSAITTTRKFHQETVAGTPAVPATATTPFVPPGPPQIITTDKVDLYTLTQSVSIASKDIQKVAAASRDITSLIQDGVEVDSGTPSYIYTRLAELKVDMLAEATKDATARATQITSNANARLGKLVEAKMGVMQINPVYTSGVSDTGNNDTTSLEKEITAIVHARFTVN